VVDASLGKVAQPTETANVSPMGNESGQTRQIVDAVRNSISPLENAVDRLQTGRIDDMWRFLYIYGGGVVLVVGMFLLGYLRLSDRVDGLDKSNVRIEQKLDDLIARIPPIPTQPRRP
jgi:hypothetical protein